MKTSRRLYRFLWVLERKCRVDGQDFGFVLPDEVDKPCVFLREALIRDETGKKYKKYVAFLILRAII